MTNHPPSVLWHCWLGHQTCKNRRPYNLYCVGADVNAQSINVRYTGYMYRKPHELMQESGNLKRTRWKSRGHAPWCPIAGDATEPVHAQYTRPCAAQYDRLLLTHGRGSICRHSIKTELYEHGRRPATILLATHRDAGKWDLPERNPIHIHSWRNIAKKNSMIDVLALL